MSRKMKKKSETFQYLTLIIVLIILVIIFYLTNDDEIASQASNPPLTSDNISTDTITINDSKTINDNTIISDNTTTIEGGSENITTDIYTLYDTYIMASDKTTYAQSGYKYFVIRSYSEYEKYLNTNLISPFDNTYVSNYIEINEQTFNDIKNNIDKDFFKSNSIIFVVDYSAKEIKSNINNIDIRDNTASITIDRNANNTSKYVTHLIPINCTNINNVEINYIR